MLQRLNVSEIAVDTWAQLQAGPTHRRWINTIGTLGVVLALSGFLLERNIMRLGEILTFLAFFAALPVAWRFLRSDPVFWLFVAWAGALVISNSLAITSPDIPTDHSIWNAARHWSRLGWIPLMAWIIAGRVGVARAALLGYVGAWFLLTLPELSLNVVADALQGARLDFGTGNPHRAALPFMLTTIIVVFLAKDCIGPRTQAWPVFAVRLTLWTTALAYSLFGLGAAQGAGPTIGTLAAIIIAALALWSHLTTDQFLSRRILSLAGSAAILLTILALFAVAFKPAIEDRAQTFTEGIAQLQDGNIDNKTGTIGARYYLWTFAADKIRERPLFGYGTETAQEMIPASDLPKPTRERFGHLHNSGLELLFSLGAAGFLIFCTLFGYVTYKVCRSVLTKQMPQRYGLLFCALTLGFALGNTGESYIVFNHFWPHLALISAPFYSLAAFRGHPT